MQFVKHALNYIWPQVSPHISCVYTLKITTQLKSLIFLNNSWRSYEFQGIKWYPIPEEVLLVSMLRMVLITIWDGFSFSSLHIQYLLRYRLMQFILHQHEVPDNSQAVAIWRLNQFGREVVLLNQSACCIKKKIIMRRTREMKYLGLFIRTLQIRWKGLSKGFIIY